MDGSVTLTRLPRHADHHRCEMCWRSRRLRRPATHQLKPASGPPVRVCRRHRERFASKPIPAGLCRLCWLIGLRDTPAAEIGSDGAGVCGRCIERITAQTADDAEELVPEQVAAQEIALDCDGDHAEVLRAMNAEVERLEAAVCSEPQNADVVDELQAALLRRGQVRSWEQPLRDAVADFDAAIRLDPDNPACYQFLGSALTLMGHLDTAGRHFNEMARRRDLIAWHLAARTTDDMAEYLAGAVQKGRPDPFLRWFGDTAQVLVRQAWGRVREADDPDGWAVLAEGVKQRLVAGGWEAKAGRWSLICRWSGSSEPSTAPDMLHAAEHDAMPEMV